MIHAATSSRGIQLTKFKHLQKGYWHSTSHMSLHVTDGEKWAFTIHISSTELKPISQAGAAHASGVKSQLKLIPPWGCRQVCSSTSACAAEDGIAVTCASWEGRELLHLPASRTGCGSSPLPSSLLPLLQFSGQSHMGTLHHSSPLGYAKQVDFTWNRLGSACMIPFPFSAKQHWAPTLINNG